MKGLLSDIASMWRKKVEGENLGHAFCGYLNQYGAVGGFTRSFL